jgi:branched-chain amino acid aminotransferase
MLAQRFRIEPSPNPTSPERRAELLRAPVFGKVFTDHMLVMRYTAADGWEDGVIRARAPFSIDPACAVLHYSQEIFEGMKAYRTAQGDPVLFRPLANAQRFKASAARLAMPEIPEALFRDAVAALVSQERDWIPASSGGSLYLRPFMFASEAFLGVRPSHEYLFVVIASPVGAYFSGGASALKLWVSQDFSRAAPGGTGAAKCGGNYAASLLAQAEGMKAGCDQVLFLDAVEHRWIEELGGMNIFFAFADGSLSTPPLSGTILPGITRDSLITLARDQGRVVREEPYAIEQCQADAASGRLVEAFACGTAAVVAPIGRMVGPALNIEIAGGQPGPVATGLRAALAGIQTGEASDPHGWVDRLG